MLIDDIKRKNMEALKAHDQVARAIYSVIINKFMPVNIEKKEKGEIIDDKDLIAIIVKSLKELADEKASYAKVNNTQKVLDIEKQEELLKVFLPKMLSEEEIRNEILKLDDKSLPNIMKYFKINFVGRVDMGLVNRIAKEL